MSKVIDAFMVIIMICYILGIIFVVRCLIVMFACDYEMWKRKKEDKNHRHQMEDKFKNRKLTD